MKIRKLLILCIFSMIVFGFSGVSFAACGVYGKVVRIYTRTIGTSNLSYFYIAPRNTGLANYNWYVYVPTSDSETGASLRAALSSGDTVYINGSIASCPTTGSARYIGMTNYMYVFPNY